MYYAVRRGSTRSESAGKIVDILLKAGADPMWAIWKSVHANDLVYAKRMITLSIRRHGLALVLENLRGALQYAQATIQKARSQLGKVRMRTVAALLVEYGANFSA